MSARPAVALARRWVRRYTRGLPAPVAARRIDEIDADLLDHLDHERALGTHDARIALAIVSRVVRGVTADLAWRGEQTAMQARPTTSGGSMTDQTARLLGTALALVSFAFLAWIVAALGLVGAEGDRFDLVYLVLALVGVVGAGLARFRPAPMARLLVGLASAQAVITVVALALGKHEHPSTSIAELVGLNAMFIVLFLAAAWLFQLAIPRASAAADPIG